MNDNNIIKCLEEYVGEPIRLLNSRQDPMLSYSIVVETTNHGCFIINEVDGKLKVYTKFTLEPNQSLKDLTSSEEGLVKSVSL
ncbi:hypothetical protein KAR91_46160 [Candidatus Pacearchaeota archaeon]|nr:hypothetical protein [Candidatus Pacearchaeota archaeon]